MVSFSLRQRIFLYPIPDTRPVSFHLSQFGQLGKTRENLQLRDDTVSSQAVMIKQDSASFADSSCHSSPVGSVLFKNGFFPDKMLISRALHRSIAVFNSPVTFRFRRLFWPKLLRHLPSARLMRDKCAYEWRAINALSRNDAKHSALSDAATEARPGES
jgi:hypothetical protein